MEKRREKTKNEEARRVPAARLAVVCAFGVCLSILLFEGVEYILSFRREPFALTASAGDTARLFAEEADGRMDINRATVEDLLAVPGFGPELAQGILALREARGGFHVLEELKDVNGIGDKRFLALKAYFFCPLPDVQPPAPSPSF